jgi:hypothetical protein
MATRDEIQAVLGGFEGLWNYSDEITSIGDGYFNLGDDADPLSLEELLGDIPEKEIAILLEALIDGRLMVKPDEPDADEESGEIAIPARLQQAAR